VQWQPLIITTDRGLYCPLGEFYIDPWRCDPSMRAITTHAHSDHAKVGCGSYLCPPSGEALLRTRLGHGITVQTHPYGLAHSLRMGGVNISLLPAGHVLGSAMVRVSRATPSPSPVNDGGTWLVTGDYKRAADGVSETAEPCACNTLITESTFGLPIYRWRPAAVLSDELNRWWQSCQREGRTAVVFCYALGKAQRIAAMADASLGKIMAHGAPLKLCEVYRTCGVALPPIKAVDAAEVKQLAKSGAASLIIAPPSADGSTWMKKLGDCSRAFASGWMMVRGNRRRRSLDKGLVVSDHCDWPALLRTIAETNAEHVGVTHGFITPMVRYLTERGLHAFPVETRFVGEQDAAASDEPVPAEISGPAADP